MSEKELTEESLLDNIEGLLFSEAYADSEDNASLISQIADTEISPENAAINEEEGEKSEEKKSSKGRSLNVNVQENVLNVDESENLFEKGFGPLTIEKICDSIRANKGKKASSVGNTTLKKSLELKFLRKPIWDSNGSASISLDSYMKMGFVGESLSDIAVDLKNINSPFINPMQTFFYKSGCSKVERLCDFAGNYKETKEPPVTLKRKNVQADEENTNAPAIVRCQSNLEKKKTLAEPAKRNSESKCEKSKTIADPNVFVDSKKKKSLVESPKRKTPTSDVFAINSQNKSVKNAPEPKRESIIVASPDVFANSNNKKIPVESEKKNTLASDAFSIDTQNKSVKKFTESQQESIIVSSPNGLVDSKKRKEKINFEKNKSQSKEDIFAETSKDFAQTDKEIKKSSFDTEKSKVSIDSAENTFSSKDLTGQKKRCREITANSAVSITSDKNVSLALSFQRTQGDEFFTSKKKCGKSSFDNSFFNTLRKESQKNKIQNGKGLFSLDDGLSSKKNSDSAFEKKSKMSLFDNNKKYSTYESLNNNFKQKKELF